MYREVLSRCEKSARRKQRPRELPALRHCHPTPETVHALARRSPSWLGRSGAGVFQDLSREVRPGRIASTVERCRKGGQMRRSYFASLTNEIGRASCRERG